MTFDPPFGTIFGRPKMQKTNQNEAKMRTQRAWKEERNQKHEKHNFAIPSINKTPVFENFKM